MITVRSRGSFRNTDRFFNRMRKMEIMRALAQYGEEGRNALANATPVRSGLTADSWTYDIVRNRSTYTIVWRNTNMAGNTPVAILLQYGHATGTGGYVQGLDYINPAIRPVFDKIADEVWRVVTTA